MRLRYWFRYNGNGFRISVSKISPVPLIRELISGNKYFLSEYLVTILQLTFNLIICIYFIERYSVSGRRGKHENRSAPYPESDFA